MYAIDASVYITLTDCAAPSVLPNSSAKHSSPCKMPSGIQGPGLMPDSLLAIYSVELTAGPSCCAGLCVYMCAGQRLWSSVINIASGWGGRGLLPSVKAQKHTKPERRVSLCLHVSLSLNHEIITRRTFTSFPAKRSIATRPKVMLYAAKTHYRSPQFTVGEVLSQHMLLERKK